MRGHFFVVFDVDRGDRKGLGSHTCEALPFGFDISAVRTPGGIEENQDGLISALRDAPIEIVSIEQTGF
jgi:hypothetical protein